MATNKNLSRSYKHKSHDKTKKKRRRRHSKTKRSHRHAMSWKNHYIYESDNERDITSINKNNIIKNNINGNIINGLRDFLKIKNKNNKGA
jgi:hypothetical protein